MEDTGLVRIVRKSERDIKLRDLYVKLDDGEEHNLKFPAELELKVGMGVHTIHATNRLYKRHLEFEIAAAGDQVVFEVANTASGCAGALFTVGGPYRVELRRVE